ncbi:MAG: hypothetical protein ACR2KZ_00420 [Segetibacter sp.]
MKKTSIIFSLILFSILEASSQELVFDPALSANLAVNGAREDNSLKAIKEKQVIIQNLQSATVTTVNFINDWQKKTYEGLIYVSSSVKNVYQLYECATMLSKIYENESNMISEAQKNPIALGFATKMQTEMITRAIGLYGQIQQLILKEGDKNLLMDAGERTKLMNELLRDLSVINSYAYSSYLKVRLVVRQGLINSINPFGNFVNRDAQIVKDVIGKWKF